MLSFTLRLHALLPCDQLHLDRCVVVTRKGAKSAAKASVLSPPCAHTMAYVMLAAKLHKYGASCKWSPCPTPRKLEAASLWRKMPQDHQTPDTRDDQGEGKSGEVEVVGGRAPWYLASASVLGVRPTTPSSAHDYDAMRQPATRAQHSAWTEEASNKMVAPALRGMISFRLPDIPDFAGVVLHAATEARTGLCTGKVQAVWTLDQVRALMAALPSDPSAAVISAFPAPTSTPMHSTCRHLSLARSLSRSCACHSLTL